MGLSVSTHREGPLGFSSCLVRAVKAISHTRRTDGYGSDCCRPRGSHSRVLSAVWRQSLLALRLTAIEPPQILPTFYEILMPAAAF